MPTVTAANRMRRWSVGAVVVIGCTLGLADAAVASSSPASAGTAPPCSVEIETGAGETMPSTTLPGTCSISATSGTMPAPAVVTPSPPPSTVVVWTSDSAGRLVVVRYAVIGAVHFAISLSVTSP